MGEDVNVDDKGDQDDQKDQCEEGGGEMEEEETDQEVEVNQDSPHSDNDQTYAREAALMEQHSFTKEFDAASKLINKNLCEESVSGAKNVMLLPTPSRRGFTTAPASCQGI